MTAIQQIMGQLKDTISKLLAFQCHTVKNEQESTVISHFLFAFCASRFSDR